ncbi:MAG: polysaccharide biosynthesis/export family protein [Thermoanaerobaculia bacterium]|nr:polysaccharide biosynthesis/export family protein [Thermoanaerobaculia bacterium]
MNQATLRHGAVLVAMLAILAGAASFALPAAAQDFGEYRIGPKDLLDIKVLEAPELNGERRVSDNGAVSLPLLGEVSVSGLTAAETRDRIGALLTSRYVQRANVTVSIKEFSNKPITVIGAVARPGSLSISGRYHLLQVISAAGGLTANAGRKIYVLRNSENGLSDTLEVRTSDLFESANPMWNIPIAASDVINIPAQSAVKIFCLGEVKSPGQLTFDSGDRITLLAAISKAGGMTDRASNTVKITRRSADGKDSEIVVKYGAILKGRVTDPELKPDDVIVVEESFF